MVFPDPLHLTIALGPLALYLLRIGWINLSRRPVLKTGVWDAAAIGFGVSGFVFAGPMELFMPEGAAMSLRGWVWLLLLALYALCVSLIVLLMRPKLILYNIALDQLRPIVGGVVANLDEDARWAGDNLVMPNLCVQLHIEQSSLFRTAELVATASGPGWQSHEVYQGWHRLERALRTALREVPSPPNPIGIGFLLSGLAFAGMIGMFMVRSRPEVTQALWEMLRL